MPTNPQVKFYRGPESSYILGGSAPAGQDVSYNSNYEGCIYYATDARVVYIDGIRYGFNASSEGELQKAFVEVSYTKPSQSNGYHASLTFKQFNDTTVSVDLFKVTSASQAIEVTHDAANADDFKVGLKIHDNDTTLTQDNGLRVNIGLSYDSANKQINLTGKTVNGNPAIIASVDASDFVRDGMVKSVTIVNEDPTTPDATSPSGYKQGRFLKIEWNSAAGQGDQDSSTDFYDDTTVNSITYVDLADLFNDYKAGNAAISVSNDYDTDAYTISLVVDNSSDSSTFLSISGDGLAFDGDSINDHFSGIEGTTINGHAISTRNIAINGREVLLGTIGDLSNLDGTSIDAADSVNKAIQKLNALISGSSGALQSEVDNIEQAVGLAQDGQIGHPFTGSARLVDSSTVIGAVKVLDASLQQVETTIENLDWNESNTADFIVNVTQTNGQISASGGWVSEKQLHNYGPIGNSLHETGGTIQSTDSINNAMGKIDNTITWHIVEQGSSPQTGD